MNASPLRLDHLVVAARTLEEGVQYVSDTLGVAPAGGGAHPLMRTHNRLLGLWGGVYLEVISIDPAAKSDANARARLFALDDPAVQARLEQGPYLSHWVARVDPPKNLARWREQYPQRIPELVPMTRGDFSWQLTVPQDGALPAWQGAGDGILPSLIQWDTAHHPSQGLADTGIALTSLSGFHPQAQVAREQLQWLGAAHLIAVEEALSPALVAQFETPSGPRTLGAPAR
ncbi:VOC family protein [Paraburkholderia acidiphila]|uniref:VOC family protein n=1 Tax=Paraburkholderia acidiphila TaxID=2571747 RepID=A0A7Z2J892_9BURK|nr:VOC family protein [Paraburkholderia acidiphila]QGZ54159.1 VOC family protein [Paraburkholderia acidiphila]